jgi:hypothetical protein
MPHELGRKQRAALHGGGIGANIVFSAVCGGAALWIAQVPDDLPLARYLALNGVGSLACMAIAAWPMRRQPWSAEPSDGYRLTTLLRR